MRALARDLGRMLGCFGHVSALRRTRVGPFAEADAVALADLEASGAAARGAAARRGGPDARSRASSSTATAPRGCGAASR